MYPLDTWWEYRLSPMVGSSDQTIGRFISKSKTSCFSYTVRTVPSKWANCDLWLWQCLFSTKYLCSELSIELQLLFITDLSTCEYSILLYYTYFFVKEIKNDLDLRKYCFVHVLRVISICLPEVSSEDTHGAQIKHLKRERKKTWKFFQMNSTDSLSMSSRKCGSDTTNRIYNRELPINNCRCNDTCSHFPN